MNQQEILLHAFRGVKPGAKAGIWSAFCPVHKGGEERNRSLSLYVGGEGKLHVECFACHAELKTILDAAGIPMRDWLQKDDGESKVKKKYEAKRKTVAWYDYRDEDGRLLYQVVRYDPKGFCQRRPKPGYDVDERGRPTDPRENSWIWMLGDVRRVIYRLPEILAKPEWPVVVVEGEKDADRLVGMGLLATCNVGGVGMGWQPAYGDSLRGRRVVVVPDKDAAGWTHAFGVAGSLVWHGAASVRILAMPDPAKDISEWFDRGGTKEAFQEMARLAPEWRPAGKARVA